MKKIGSYLSFGLALALTSSFAREAPGDSVIGPEKRGRSGILLGNSGSGGVSILHSVPLASQTNLDFFVDYGPFINESSSKMIVSLVSDGMDGRRTLVGGVLGGVRYESVDSITFEVQPKEIFGFSVKDFANLTISLTNGRFDEGGAGIPSASDFMSPTGKYLRCIDLGWTDSEGVVVKSQIYYLYEAGSMSDRSIRRDYINRMDSKVTGGVRPAEPGRCVME